MHSSRAERAFTLIELLLAMACLATVLGFAGALIIKSMQLSAKAGRVEAALAGATRTLERMGKDVRASEGARLKEGSLVTAGASYSLKEGSLFRGKDLVCRDLSKVEFRVKAGGRLVECAVELAPFPGKPLYGAWCARGAR